ncbi:MAG: hypothetical protein KIT68_01375 [Phycisphaeraceae bacterium]|nr:hypothetical protein [Phycisphaeraceae bacterium]
MNGHDEHAQATATPGQNAQPQALPTPPAEPGLTADAAGEQAMSFLSSIERQVADLRRLTGESARRARELDERDAALKVRAVEIDRLIAEQRDAAQRAEARAAEADAARRQAEANAHAAQTQRAELESRVEEHLRRAEALTADLARQADAAGQAQRHAADAAARAADLERRLSEADAALARARTDAEQATSAAEQARQQAEQFRQAAERAEATRAEIEGRLSRLAGELEAANQLLTDAAARQTAAEAQIREANERAQTESRRAEVLTGELSETRRTLTEACDERESLRRSLEAEAQAGAQCRQRAERAEHAERTAVEAARLAQQQIAEASQTAGGQGVALQAAQEQCEAFRKLAEELRDALSQAERDRDTLDGKVKDLLEELESARKAQTETAQAGLDRGQELESLKHLVAQREEALRVLAGRLLNAEERLNAADDNPGATPAEVAALREQLELARAEAAALRAQAEGGPAVVTMDPEAAEFVARRRERLARYRALLAAQSHKIVQARAALAKKNEKADEAIALRAKLNEQMQALAAERRKVQQQSARSGAGVMLLCFFGVLAIIGGLAWAVAGQVAPATFAARAVIAADTPGRTPTQEEMLAWTASHERLMEDPDFFVLAAERFAQRGIATMGTPASVKQRLKSEFSVQTDKAGALTLELRGRGAEKTARELETLALAIVAMANSQREARGDGAATVLSQAPAAMNEPLDDQRLTFVAAFGGGGSAVAGLLFVGFYRMLAGGKRRFEQQMLKIENE